MTGWLERSGVAALLVAACGGVFMYVDHLNAQLVAKGAHFTDIELRLDAHIPLVPAFVFAYLLYYVWILLPVVALREREHFYHAVAAFTVLQLAAVVTFLVFPTYMTRPVVAGTGLARDLVRWLYSADQGCNLIPSLHVGHTVLVAMFFRAQRSRWFPLVALGTALISASTVLIKQHYLVDVPAGFAFAVAAYYVTVPISHRMRGPAVDRYSAAA